jgi:hypothetical protein
MEQRQNHPACPRVGPPAGGASDPNTGRAGDTTLGAREMMEPMKPGLTLLLGVLLAACGGGADPGGGGRQSDRPDRPAETLYSAVDHCGGLGTTEAASLLGVPADEVEMKVLGEMMDNACSIQSSAGPLGGVVTFTLREESSVAEAESAFDRQAGDFATTVTSEAVTELGDEALWFGSADPVVLDRLLARKGNVWLDVISAPNGREGSMAVARAVLQRLESPE